MAAVVLRLYVNGRTPRSELALANLRRLIAGSATVPVDLDVVDILEHPEVAEHQNLLATPTLVKLSPPPMRRVIGDLSDTQAVSDALGLGQSDPLAQE